MKTAKIKTGRGKDYFFLENIDSRIPSSHKKISDYRQKRIETGLTTTILNEFTPDKIRRIVDEKCWSFNFAKRMHIINQINIKKREIIEKFSLHDINTNEIKELLQDVSNFYTNPARKQALEDLSRRKGRKFLLPGPNDRTILAECCHLQKNYKQIILVTDDGDFTNFGEEIKKVFGVIIDRIV